MELIFQVLFELLLQFLFEGAADLLFGELGSERPLLRVFLFALLGACLGFASLAFAPEHLIADRALRSAAALVIPVVIGFAMAQIGRFRRRHGKSPRGLEYFFSSWAFAFAFGALRVALAK